MIMDRMDTQELNSEFGDGTKYNDFPSHGNDDTEITDFNEDGCDNSRPIGEPLYQTGPVTSVAPVRKTNNLIPKRPVGGSRTFLYIEFFYRFLINVFEGMTEHQLTLLSTTLGKSSFRSSSPVYSETTVKRQRQFLFFINAHEVRPYLTDTSCTNSKIVQHI